jgi:hypothetical protein
MVRSNRACRSVMVQDRSAWPRERQREGRGEQRRKTLSYTAWPITSLGSRFPLRKREQPDISLRLHASIRRQLNEGATDPLSIATEAFKALGETSEPGTPKPQES